MEVLRAVFLGHTRPQGGVGVHALAGRGTRQQLQEHLIVPESGENLFDTHHADEGFRQGQAHAAVTFGLHNRDVPGFGDTEVSARNGDLGLHELLPQVHAGSLGQFGGLGGNGIIHVRHLLEEDAADLSPVPVNGRHENVGRLVLTQLHNELRKVGLLGKNAHLFQLLIQGDFLGGHRLDLDHFLFPSGLHQFGDDLASLFGVAGPVHVPTAGGDGGFELFQQLRQVGHHIPFGGGTGLAQILPVVDLVDHTLPLVTDGGGGLSEVTTLGNVIEPIVGGVREGFIAPQV